MKQNTIVLLFGILLAVGGCEKQYDKTADAQGHTAPTSYTAEANAKVSKDLPLDDQQDFEDAKRGLIAQEANLKVMGTDKNIIWDQTAYQFIKGNAPDSVNPSLWRQEKLNNIHGLFKVTEDVYQTRGYDLSNLTFIKGKTGWILIDPCTSKETAARSVAFAEKHLGDIKIKAVIITHSHADHFGGVNSLFPTEDSAKGVDIIAPVGFMEEAVSENLIAGIGMARRSHYMYGGRLARSVRGHVGSGLGKEPAMGNIGIRKPTRLITRTGQEMILDGVRFVFQNVPGSEAPAELTFYLPDLKAYCGGEILSKNMHNLYTLRGAKVRDALKWSNYISEATELFGGAEVYFGTHHWPVWGNKRVIEYMKKQRDIYKYIHDQTVRMANSGYTPREIAEQIQFPESLRTTFSVRGYYGTLQHNAKAVYQHYFGWYDANPVNLNPLPPAQSAEYYVEFMGGADKLLTNAQTFYDKGEYRWVAEVLNHLVFADPDNTKAISLLARTYDQLGYQSESGPWRDVYLTAAYELRHGAPDEALDISKALELLEQTPTALFFDSMAARLNGPKADGKTVVINIFFTDINESYVLNLENAVLHHKKTKPDPKANATIKLTKKLYLRIATGQAGISDLLTSDEIEFSGSKIDMIRFFALFERPKGDFNIVTP